MTAAGSFSLRLPAIVIHGIDKLPLSLFHGYLELVRRKNGFVEPSRPIDRKSRASNLDPDLDGGNHGQLGWIEFRHEKRDHNFPASM